MIQIKSGRLLPKNSGIGKMINLLKTLDETLHTEIMDEYKQILSSKKWQEIYLYMAPYL